MWADITTNLAIYGLMRSFALMKGYLYILGSISFTVYGQLVLKWRISQKGALPVDSTDAILFLFKLFLDPFIVSGFASAFVASLFWMAAMTKFPVSYAYPFTSISFGMVLIFSAIFLGEPITTAKIAGLAIIIVGIVVAAQ